MGFFTPLVTYFSIINFNLCVSYSIGGYSMDSSNIIVLYPLVGPVGKKSSPFLPPHSPAYYTHMRKYASKETEGDAGQTLRRF
jgi:hypothetical protein